MKIKHRGQLLTAIELEEIADDYIITKHAQERIDTRYPDLDIEGTIRHPMLAYFNTDGSVNIALNKFEYLVVATDCKPYKIVTFKEKSHHNIDIFQKREMAQNGYNRKAV